MSLKPLLDAFSETRFVAEGTPFPSHVFAQDSRVVVIAGANATGKSLTFRCLAGLGHELEMPAITLSIRERTGGGTFEMASMRRMMIYGDEQEQSTGATSMQVIARGFDNVIGRIKKEEPAPLLMLDEPEIGLSEGYTRALGRYLAEKVQQLPEGAPGLVVVTHSRSMIEALSNALPSPPSFIYMGQAAMSLDDWLITAEDRTVDELLNLKNLGNEGRRNFTAWLDKREAELEEENKQAIVSAPPAAKKNRRPAR